MKTRLWLALAVGLALRAGYAWYAQSRHLVPTDVDQYETIAMNVLERGSYSVEGDQPTASREPGYPLLIAAVYKLCGGRRPWAMLALNCAMSLATGWLVLLLGERLLGESGGFAALCVWMLYPQAVYYCGYFFRETFTTLLLTGVVCASTRWADERAGGRAALAGGLAAGVLGVTNSGLLPAAVFCGLGLWPVTAGATRWRRLALYYAPVLLLSALWTARNEAAMGRLVLGSTHGGEEFYQALVVPPEDLGTERQTAILRDDAALKSVAGAPEAPRNAALLRASARWIAAHPAEYVSRALAGIAKFWRLWPYERRYGHAYWKIFLASLAFDAWIVPLGLWELLRRRRGRRLAPAGPIAVAATTLLYGLIHAVIRYRLPLMPYVAVLAVGFLIPSRRMDRSAR